MDKLQKIILKSILIISLIYPSLKTVAQDIVSAEVKQWFIEDMGSQVDIASGFYYDNCSYLGIFGENHHKFNIRFDTIYQKHGTQNYYIEGKSILNGKIAPFKGELNVEHLDLYYTKPLSLAVSGSYYLVEENGGVFKGVFRKYMSNKTRDIEKLSFGNIDGEVSHKEGFAGVWIDPISKKQYQCLFGFYRYPETLAIGFDTKGGEPHIHPKFRSYGWNEFFEKQNGHGVYTNVECNYDWWK